MRYWQNRRSGAESSIVSSLVEHIGSAVELWLSGVDEESQEPREHVRNSGNPDPSICRAGCVTGCLAGEAKKGAKDGPTKPRGELLP